MTSERNIDDLTPVPLARAVTKRQAREYLSLCESSFDAWVRAGRIPGPISGTNRWDIRAINAAIDKLSRIEQDSQISELEKWKAERDACSP